MWISDHDQQSTGRTKANKRTSAFTLLEVILAIVIALGILVVLLYFYEQSTNLRTQIIDETERISAIRLMMERISGELRTIQCIPGIGAGLTGTSNSIQFVKSDVPSYATWAGGGLGRAVAPLTDLKQIRYSLESADGTNVTGLLRAEEPLVAKRNPIVLDEQGENGMTNSSPAGDSLPVIPEIQFLQLRYWSGTNWLDSWDAAALPEGIELSLGSAPITNGTDVIDLGQDIFRRVIFLPVNGVRDGGFFTNTVTPSAASSSNEAGL